MSLHLSRRRFLAALGGAVSTSIAGCANSDSSSPGTMTSVTTTEPTTATSKATSTTEPTTSTVEAVELPAALEPGTVPDEQLQQEYESQIRPVGDYEQRKQQASIDGITGLENIAKEFEGDREMQLAHISAALASEYRIALDNWEQYEDLSQTLAFAAHDVLDWFNFEDGMRADPETAYSGGQIEGILFNYTDSNGEQKRSMIANDVSTTDVYDDWITNVNDSIYMSVESLGASLAMDCEAIIAAAQENDRWSEEDWRGMNDGHDNFLYGARDADANVVLTKVGGLALTERLKASPGEARAVKDEFNTAYIAATDEYDMNEYFMRVDAPSEELVYDIVSVETANQQMIWDVST